MREADEIREWLREHDLESYTDRFRENDIDLRALLHLTDQDLKDIGVSLGHRRILLAAISSRQRASSTSPIPFHHPSGRMTAGGERRQLTVMFCDLVGSTELARHLDPEDLLKIMQRYRNAISDAVDRYQGYVAQYLGDGVVVYFGWPSAFEDQAERAVRAGLDSIAAVKSLNNNDGIVIQSRVGIDTGEVVVGDMLEEARRRSQSATGETPNRAARLQSIAEPNQLVIGSNTRRLIGTLFNLKDLGDQALKGFESKEPAWAVLDVSSVESRFEAAHGAALSELVGREHELGLLVARWGDVLDGEGQVVSLSGEAGIGKSRLVRDFTLKTDRQRGVFYYQCSPHHSNNAFYPIIRQVQRAAGILVEDSDKLKLKKMESILLEQDDNTEYVARLFAILLSLRGQELYGGQEYTPQQLRHRIIEAVVDQIILASKIKPVLVLVEDAHWIDPSMGEFVTEFMPRVISHRILLLITYRPQNAPIWSVSPNVTAINLNRLGRRQALMLANEVSSEQLSREVIEDIVKRAEGVPLYVEELCKSVLESVELGEGHVPSSLRSSLVARLDHLGEAKELAQIGSVIGREFSLKLLAACAGRTEGEVANELEALVESALVYRRGIWPDSFYTFKHALIQDAAYGSILLTHRQKLHGMIVALLEAQGNSPSSELIYLIGHHAYQATISDKAFRYLSEAGALAMDRAEIREAVAHYERALHATSSLAKTREFSEQVIDLRFELRNALWSIGEFKKILIHLQGAEKLALELEDPIRTGWILVYKSASYWQLGQANDAITSAREAVEISERTVDLSLGVGANFYLGCVHLTSGNHERAEKRFESIVQLVHGDLSHDRCGLPFVPSVVARSWLVWSLAERGEFELSHQYAKEALKIAVKVGNPFNLAHIYYDLGYLYAIQGEYQQAVEAQEKAFSIITEWNLTYLSPFIGGFLGHAYALAGSHAKAVSTLEQAMQAYETIGLGLFRSLITVQFAEALMLDNQIEKAKPTALEGLNLSVIRDELGFQVHAHRVIAQLALKSSLIDDASKHFTVALELSKKMGMRPLLAHSHLGLAHVARAKENQKLTVQYSSQARELYIDMSMWHWADQATLLMEGG